MKCSLLIVMLAASTLLAAAGDAKRAAPPQKPLEHLLWPKGAPGAFPRFAVLRIHSIVGYIGQMKSVLCRVSRPLRIPPS